MSVNPSMLMPSSGTGLNLQPGEIWEVSRAARCPVKDATQLLYSASAQAFLQGQTAPRYVLIITEAGGEADWQVTAVMVLSTEIQHLSDVDILIPPSISGLEQAVLAETWHIQEMLTCNLSRKVGRRLSRPIYDVLLTIGDAHEGIAEAPAKSEIQQLGLQIGQIATHQSLQIQAFHQAEEAWSDVLTVPLAGYRAYLKGMARSQHILSEAMQSEREFTALERVNLSQWFQGVVDIGWQQFSQFWIEQPSLAMATRSDEPQQEVSLQSDEITVLLGQLQNSLDELQRRSIAKRLGEIALGSSEAIQALLNLLPLTHDDETLWAVVESLWKLDPGHPAVGVRQVKLIDLGTQLANHSVALAVALVQKANQQVGILVQIYPTEGATSLPPQLKLILLDQTGHVLREVVAQPVDAYIQLKFSGQPGEEFGIQVAIADAKITEHFVI